jgi:hypothetical protein
MESREKEIAHGRAWQGMMARWSEDSGGEAEENCSAVQ